MEQEDSLELIKSFSGKTIDDIDYTEDLTGGIMTIKFTNNETLVVSGDNFDIYFAVPKDTDYH